MQWFRVEHFEKPRAGHRRTRAGSSVTQAVESEGDITAGLMANAWLCEPTKWTHKAWCQVKQSFDRHVATIAVLGAVAMSPSSRHHREAGKRHHQPAQTDRKHSFEISQHERRLWRVFFEGLCSPLCFLRWQCVSKPIDEQQVVQLVERYTPRVALTAPTERSCNKCLFCTRTSPWTVVRTQRRKFFVRTTDNSNKQTRKENKATGTGASTVQIPSVMRYMSRMPGSLFLRRSALPRTPGQTLVCQVFLTPRTLPR